MHELQSFRALQVDPFAIYRNLRLINPSPYLFFLRCEGPVILGSDGAGRDAISVGLWAFEDELRPRLLERAGIPDEVSRSWFARAFESRVPALCAITA